ncbi:hypothetical protein BDZ91DRAFT_737996 [Kalaharituber pfeilii]|nr:hypothetical protein BDZ91DRAFT_737996 [Kalaharituber pfeilii]
MFVISSTASSGVSARSARSSHKSWKVLLGEIPAVLNFAILSSEFRFHGGRFVAILLGLGRSGDVLATVVVS